jgi:enterobactin synthetase component D
LNIAIRKFEGGARTRTAELSLPFLLSARVQQRLVFVGSHLEAEVSNNEFGLSSTREMRLHARKIQFETGRYCAAEILSDLGCQLGTVNKSSDGSPIWPNGFVGSITHADNLVGVAIASAKSVRSIGIDLESVLPDSIAKEIEPVCLLSSEVALCAAMNFDRTIFNTICFSAKEAFFKCVYPLVDIFFDFHDAEIQRIDVAANRLSICLLRSLSVEFHRGMVFHGSYRQENQYILTSFEFSLGEEEL